VPYSVYFSSAPSLLCSPVWRRVTPLLLVDSTVLFRVKALSTVPL
jgi:hypothetical protein